jgi:hypothetical protein
MSQQPSIPIVVSDDDGKVYGDNEEPPKLEPQANYEHFGVREEGVDPIVALERNQAEMLDRMHRFGQDVGNVVQNLWSEIQQSKRSKQTSNVSMVSAKPPKPDPFSGSTSPGDRVDLWLFTMERYCDAVKMQAEQRVPFAATFLRSGAATWWRAHLTLVREEKEQLITDWSRFSASITAQFKPVNWRKIARDKLHNLRQIGSVSQYVYTFHALCLDVGNISEDEKLDRFIRGLKPRVQQEVELADPKRLRQQCRLPNELIPSSGQDDYVSKVHNLEKLHRGEIVHLTLNVK